MKYIKRLSWALGIVLFAVSALQSQQTAASTESCTVVERALAAYYHLKPGMTRAEVERDFRLEGGPRPRSLSRYAYKECQYIKLEIEYTPDPDQREGLGSARDVVKTLSKLTIAYPTTD